MKEKFDRIIDLCIRRGFFYQSCEIYGGKAGFYDYGSLGKLLKERWIALWKNYFLNLHDNFWEIEPNEIMDEKVFIASGHLKHFNDPIVECKKGHRFRADKLIEEKLGISAEGKSLEEMNLLIKENNIRCPICDSELSEVKWFNLMFPIFVGPEIGNFYAKLNEIKKYFDTIYQFEKIKEKLKNGKETEDGIEFIAIIKDIFEKDRENVYYAFDEGKFYIFNVKSKEIIAIDLGTRKARYWVKGKFDPGKYKDINIEEEFDKFIDEIEPFFEEIDLVNSLKELNNYYNEILKNRMFLRPETAQGPYVNFPREINIHRSKLPLGLAVVGRAFRNEISPRQALIRLREFTQAELQIFFDIDDWDDKNFEKNFDYEKIKDQKLQLLPVKYRDSGKAFIEKTIEEWRKELKLPKFYLYFLYKVQEFYLNVLKVPKEKFRLKELAENEKAFYNKYHFDVEIYFESFEEWKEVGGVHFRAIEISKDDLEKISNKKIRKLLEKVLESKDKVLVGYDLYNHLILSENTGFFVRKNEKVILPVELELSFGVDRNILALLDLFYNEEKINNEKRIVLKLPEKLAPIQVAVFPLLENKKELVKKAKEVYDLLKYKFKAYFDASGSIGRRYRRQDEIGTPFCITIDFQTLEDNTVTIRFRDTMEQIRIKIDEIEKYLWKAFC